MFLFNRTVGNLLHNIIGPDLAFSVILSAL